MKMTFHRPGIADPPMTVRVQMPPSVTPIRGKVWSISTWPKAPPVEVPDDGREYALCAEDLWAVATERLTYAAGTPFPLDERPALITTSALQDLHRQGRNANGDPA